VNDRSFTIAAAVPADVPVILDLIGALAQYERLSHLCVSTEADIAAALFGPHPAAEVLIARCGAPSGKAAGFALFFHTFSTFLGRRSLWLEDLFVRPEHRGAGIGTALLHHLFDRAGGGRVEWSVLDWNEPSIAFYRSLGAQPMEAWLLYRLTGDAMTALAEGA
jgi:GNAT superfamily N-acetyltransferase